MPCQYKSILGNNFKILIIILSLFVNFTVAGNGNGNNCKPSYENGYDSLT